MFILIFVLLYRTLLYSLLVGADCYIKAPEMCVTTNCQFFANIFLVENLLHDKKIIDKLGWLVDYQPELIRWHQMTVLTRTLESQLKEQGINQQSLTIFEKNKFELDSKLLNFQQK